MGICRVLFVHKHVGDEAAIDISAARHDANQAATERLFQLPLAR
jgi:hypothetical protein